MPEELRAAGRGPASIPRPPTDGGAEATFERYDKEELEAVLAALTRRAEKRFVEGLLAKHEGNVTHAAQESGIHRSQLQKMMARLRE